MATKQRRCDHCDRPYAYQRSTSRYCGSSCRALGPVPGRGGATVTALPGVAPAPAPGATYAAAHAALAAAGRLDTLMGVATLKLATRIDNSATETGSALATLVKQLEATAAAALADAAGTGDALDELRRIREEKRRAAAG
jgi:hypothetical protein